MLSTGNAPFICCSSIPSTSIDVQAMLELSSIVSFRLLRTAFAVVPSVEIYFAMITNHRISC